MKLIKSTLVGLLSVALIFTGCDSEENEAPQTSPEVPPVNSMLIDFSDFEDGSSDGGRQEEATNWLRAVTHVGFWHTALWVNLAIPVSSFKVAVNKSATYDNEANMWVWQYNHNFAGETYTSRLTAEIDGDNAIWKMYISEEDGFQNVLWFSGESALDGTSGYWLLNKDADNPTEYLRIDWEKENEAVGMIQYTYVEAGTDQEGSYIVYSESNEDGFNKNFELYTESDENTIEIDWNSNTGSGQIKDPNFYEDEEFHCWNTSLEDTDC